MKNNSRKSKIITILIAIPIFLFIILELNFAVNYFSQLRTPSLYILPDNYVGWVSIVYQDETCPALELKDDHKVFEIKEDGTFCTSNAIEFGRATDRYVYRSRTDINLIQNPKTGMNYIWNASNNEVSEKFYIGKKPD